MPIAEWIRQALAAIRCHEPLSDVEKKLNAVREAAKLHYPTADIDEMLAPVERSYAGGQ